MNTAMGPPEIDESLEVAIEPNIQELVHASAHGDQIGPECFRCRISRR
jgi:hypothetical protein